MEPTDEALCRRVGEGDEAAFDLLVARYQGRAYRLAWSLLRDADEARDLSQEAFLRLHRNAARFEGRARFSTWFYRILVNLCLDHRRRTRWWRRIMAPVDAAEESETPLVERQPAPLLDPADTVERERTTTRLWQAVDRLSAQQRTAVVLQTQEGLSTAEVAAVMNCAEATVRVHLHRALTTLRKTLRQE